MSIMSNLNRADCLRVAAAAEVDPRTVARYAAGGRLKPLVRSRIERTLAELGLPTVAATAPSPTAS